MFLETQFYLKEKGLQSLQNEFGIEVRENEDSVILNYGIASGQKTHPIVRECRSLCLDKTNWSVNARSFRRFFNLHECPELHKDFNWNNFTCYEKCDGSLISLYYNNKKWRINTRSTFGDGKINDFDISWEELFFNTLTPFIRTLPPYIHIDYSLDKDWTFVFELCSLYNKVVRHYERPTLYLLAAFCNSTDLELQDDELDKLANGLGVKRPQRYEFKNCDDILSFINKPDLDATFEGFVVKDNENRRLKIKNLKYLALSSIRGNGEFSPKRILPLILSNNQNDIDELVSYFPEIKSEVEALQNKVNMLRYQMECIWTYANQLQVQKDFALSIKDNYFAPILFEARKRKVHPNNLVNVDNIDLVSKILERNKNANASDRKNEMDSSFK